MDWQNGDGDAFQLRREVGVPVSLVHESVSGDRWAQGIETAGSRATGEGHRRLSGASAKKPSSSLRRVPQKAIHRRRLYLQSCIDELERAENSSEDPILKSNCLTQVRDHLQTLWELLEGDSESEAFEEMVNILQIAFCDQSLDALTPSQSAAIKSVFVKLHDEPDLDDQLANDLTELLIRGGVDVFREIG